MLTSLFVVVYFTCYILVCIKSYILVLLSPFVKLFLLTHVFNKTGCHFLALLSWLLFLLLWFLIVSDCGNHHDQLFDQIAIV